MKNLFFLIFILCIITSCEPADSEPYYAFSTLDYEFIAENYQDTEKIYVFRNSNEEEVSISVISYTLSKKYESGYIFGQSDRGQSYFYDHLWIEIDLLDFSVDGEPDGYCDRIQLQIFKTPEGLRTELQIPAYTPPLCSQGGFKETSPYQNLSVLEINGSTFNKVKTITSDHYFSFYNESQIDKVYYDFGEGFIGFDESQTNTQFRLVIE
jgi:hypothetical protein